MEPALSQPQQQAPFPPPNPNTENPNKPRKKGFLTWFLFAVIVLLVFGVGILLGFFSKNKKASSEKEPSASSTPLASSTPYSTTDPLKIFRNSFSASDYRVKVIGSIKIGSTLLSYDDNSLYYFKKGQLVRVDAKASDGNFYSTIVSQDAGYALNNTKKTYKKIALDNEDPTKSAFYNSAYFKYSMPLVQLLEDSPNLDWKKNGPSEYQTSWGYKVSASSIALPIKLNIGSDGNLNSFSIGLTNYNVWQTLTFFYDPVENIDSLMIVPQDYQLTTNL